MKLARIECVTHRINVLPGRSEETYTYEWQGPRHLPALVAVPGCGNTLADMPWPMRRLGPASAICDYAVRTDYGLWTILPYHLLKWQGKRIASLLKTRVIYTLMVWGLAHVPNSAIAQWKHVGKKR